jgi:hypothetical protein
MFLCLLGDRNNVLVPFSFLFFASLRMHETVDLLTQHDSAVRAWRLEKSSLLLFSSDIQEVDKILETYEIEV